VALDAEALADLSPVTRRHSWQGVRNPSLERESSKGSDDALPLRDSLDNLSGSQSHLEALSRAVSGSSLGLASNANLAGPAISPVAEAGELRAQSTEPDREQRAASREHRPASGAEVARREPTAWEEQAELPALEPRPSESRAGSKGQKISGSAWRRGPGRAPQPGSSDADWGAPRGPALQAGQRTPSASSATEEEEQLGPAALTPQLLEELRVLAHKGGQEPGDLRPWDEARRMEQLLSLLPTFNQALGSLMPRARVAAVRALTASRVGSSSRILRDGRRGSKRAAETPANKDLASVLLAGRGAYFLDCDGGESAVEEEVLEPGHEVSFDALERRLRELGRSDFQLKCRAAEPSEVLRLPASVVAEAAEAEDAREELRSAALHALRGRQPWNREHAHLRAIGSYLTEAVEAFGDVPDAVLDKAARGKRAVRSRRVWPWHDADGCRSRSLTLHEYAYRR